MMAISDMLRMMRPPEPMASGKPPAPMSTGDFYMPTQKLPLRFGGRQIPVTDPMYHLIEKLILQRYAPPSGPSPIGGGIPNHG